MVNYVYHEELSAFDTINNKAYIQSSTIPAVQLLQKDPLEWNKKDFKYIKTVVHPDKGGNSEDFPTIITFQKQVEDEAWIYQNLLPYYYPISKP